MSYFEKQNLIDSNGNLINPSTEDKQDQLLKILGFLNIDVAELKSLVDILNQNLVEGINYTLPSRDNQQEIRMLIGQGFNGYSLGQIFDLLDSVNNSSQEIQNSNNEILSVLETERDKEYTPYGGIGEDDNYYYFGSHTITGSWRIQRLSKTDYSAEWASGNEDPVTAWFNRESLDYSLLLN